MSDQPERYDGPGPNSDAFDPKKHLWDGRSWWTSDLRWWWDGTVWESRDVPSPAPPQGTRKPRPPGYWRDFWLGYAGTVAGNILLVIATNSALTATSGSSNGIIAVAPWLLNFIAVVAFGIWRPRVAVGMLAAYGTAFALVLLAGCLLAVVCFGGAARIP